MILTDSHCHLDDARFAADLDAVLQRARQAGVHRIVIPATQPQKWLQLQQLVSRQEGLFAAYGIHPWFYKPEYAQLFNSLPSFLEQAVAVGECGLDAMNRSVSESEQLYCFRRHLRLAAECGLPLILHAVKTVDTVLKEMRAFSGLTGVMHGFSGSARQAAALIEHGLYLGIGSAITRKQNQRLRDCVAQLPLSKLLLESDAPDQPPAAHRGQRNEPAFLVEIADTLANLHALERAEIAAICNANAQELFRL